MIAAEDMLSIQQAISAYGAGVDTGDARYFRRCFTADAELWLTGKRQSVAEYLAQCQKATARLTAMQHHCAATLLAETPDADGGISGRTPFVAYHFAPDVAEPLLIGGEYEDLFRRTPLGWRIAKRIGHPRWQSGDPRIVTSLVGGTDLESHAQHPAQDSQI